MENVIQYDITLPDGAWFKGTAPLDKIEQSIAPPALTPEVQAAINDKYGTLEARQQKVAAAASASEAVSKLDFAQLRRDARAAAQMNPEGSRAALAVLVETLIDVVEKLTTMTKGN